MAGRGEAAGVRARGSAARATAERATDREVRVVAAVLSAGSEKAAAHRLGLSHSTVKHHLWSRGADGSAGQPRDALREGSGLWRRSSPRFGWSRE